MTQVANRTFNPWTGKPNETMVPVSQSVLAPVSQPIPAPVSQPVPAPVSQPVPAPVSQPVLARPTVENRPHAATPAPSSGRRLTDILSTDADRVRRIWESSQAAGEFAPIPPGEYAADLVKGEFVRSRTNATPGFTLTFEVSDGEHRGRKLWLSCWLTEAAIPQAKRDLGKLGITSLDQLERPLPPGIRCRLRVALRRDDNGAEFNRITMFDVIEVNPPKPDAFAPVVSTTNATPNGGPK